MKVGLNVLERGVLLKILPGEGNFLTLRLIRELTNKLSLSAQEIAEFELVIDGNKTSWNVKGAQPTEIEFGDVEADLIKKKLKELDDGSKMPIQLLTVYEKFCT